MENNCDNFVEEATVLFKELADNDTKEDARRLYKVLGELYNSPRTVAESALSIINEFSSSINFTLQFALGCTYSKVARELRPLILTKYNLG